MTTYTVTAVRGDDEVWVFQCRELARVTSFGASLSDAKVLMPGLIAEAAGVDEATVEINLVVEDRPIPRPRNPDEV